MAVFVVGLVFILAFAGYSDASYCICNSGLSDAVLQKDIDYACGNGADCSPIQQSGSCYNPNTVRDHCSYAVNSYFQKKGSNIAMNCDFGGTASIVTTPPSVSSGCVYPSSSGTAGGTTPPSTTPPTGGTPTGGTPTGGTPTGGTPTPTTFPPPGTPANGGGGGTTTTPGTFPGSTVPGSPLTPGGFGLAPTGGFGSTDNASTKLLSSQSRTFMIMAVIFVSSLFV